VSIGNLNLKDSIVHGPKVLVTKTISAIFGTKGRSSGLGYTCFADRSPIRNPSGIQVRILINDALPINPGLEPITSNSNESLMAPNSS